ncbi:MAG: TIM barrel protein [Candidatus Hodarchaeota archaeon]
MRFGISPLTLELMINDVLKKKGLEGLSEFRFSDIIEGVAKAGFNHCEISLDVFQTFPIHNINAEIKKLMKIKEKYEITYSAHFPFLTIELASPNKFIREGSVKSIVDAYNSFIELEDDIDVFVLHPTGEFIADAMVFIMDPEIYPVATSLFINFSIQSIKEIIKKTGIDRNKIAIENLEFPLEATIKIVKELKTKLCLDTAHILAGFSGDCDLMEITRNYLDITSEIHLQDYDKNNKISDHSALGTGENFPLEFLELIHSNNFEGPIVFELPKRDIISSLEYIRINTPHIKTPDIKEKYLH